jgi:hypothetical protein
MNFQGVKAWQWPFVASGEVPVDILAMTDSNHFNRQDAD